VLDEEISGRVPAVSPVSREGCHDHSVLESDPADLNGLEKLGCGHCNARVSFRGLLVYCCSSIEPSFIQQFTKVDDMAVCQDDR
jgi:hypothetical protein